MRQRGGGAAVAQRTGTAERNMATALRFWVAAVVAWCAREGHGARLKEMPRDFGRACALEAAAAIAAVIRAEGGSHNGRA